jgi:hypothetical protein
VEINPEIEKLNAELGDVIINFHEYHKDMDLNRNYYLHSAFYQPKSGESPIRKELVINLLKVFADKNIYYTSAEPTIKVPGTPEDRDNANIREKILYAVRSKSNYPLLRRRWARDGTILSAAVCETGFNKKSRCAYIRRYDPRNCYWQLSNDNDKRVIAFWAVFPITLDECQKRYGVTPTSNGGMPETAYHNGSLKHIDGKTWFMQAIRWDGETRTAWVGNKFIEPKHPHLMGEIPIDVCMPFDDASDNNFGSFYLSPLVPPQAELNHVNKQRANIVSRMANPVVWGRNIVSRQFDDTKNNLEKVGGGFVGLGRQGELGLLQINDVKLLNEHEEKIINHMMRLSGFSAASFGESVGANTSGDALSMYFTPTERLIEDQNIAWNAFDMSINKKILKAFDMNMTYGEKISLDGFAPGGTVMAMEDGEHRYAPRSFNVSFTKDVIKGSYNSVVIPKNVTPKDEAKEREWALQAVRDKVISRTTAYEMFNFLSPQDELMLLEQEQANPILNPEGTQKILEAAQPQPPVGAASPALPAPAESVVPSGA